MSAMTMSREAAREAAVVSSAADAAVLSPQEARDALNAKYSAVMGGAETRPTRTRLVELVVEPFFTALPDIVEGNEDDENSRRLLAELMAICASIRMVDNTVMRLSSTYDPAVQPTEEDPEPDQPTPESISLPVSGARFRVGANFLRRIRALARRGGVWLMLADAELIAELEADNPIGVLNAIAEIQQYAAAVTFKVKLDSQQLKMLQAFFRSA